MQNIAIIGSGPTALYTVRYLLTQSKTPICITVFEAQREAGKGTPYHSHWNDKAMLANIASVEIPPIIESLVAWLERQSDPMLAKLGIERPNIDERSFFPRIVLGEYFHAQLQLLVALAKAQGSTVTVKTRHRVKDVMLCEQGIRLAFTDPDRQMHHACFTHAVLATGHVWPEQTEVRTGYFLSPWPASALQTIGNCAVGIRGTSLSAIDALVTLASARGSFVTDENGLLAYRPDADTDGFHITLMSRKGLLPEADFYHPIPYEPLSICTAQAVERLIASGCADLLDAAFALFKQELAQCAPDYASDIGLPHLSVEAFCHIYFGAREQEDPFVWAERNLAEAIKNQLRHYTVPWRYAILRMHEVIALIAPHLHAEDHARFHKHLKQIFVDDYATVPHESIERVLALHRAGKLDILRIGEDYTLDTQRPEGGATLSYEGRQLHFPAFIEAIGQPMLSSREFPFPSLRRQGVIRNAMAPHRVTTQRQTYIGGIDLDERFRPVCPIPLAANLYCLSLPFMLAQFPFAQGITSSHDMGKTVAEEIVDTAQEITAPHAIQDSIPASLH